MKNLWKTGFILLFLFTFLANKNTASALIPNIDSYKIYVQEFSTLYKGTIFLLVLCNVVIYRMKKINEKIIDHFASFSLTWMSLGMLINGIFLTIAYETDAFFETVFAVIGLLMGLYYLFSQYHEATNKKMTAALWFKTLIVGFVDLALLFTISKNNAILIILFQNIFLMFWESYQFKKKQTSLH